MKKASKKQAVNDSQFELLFNFCGEFDAILKKDYKNSKLKEAITYTQYCIVMFTNVMNEATELLNYNKK